jgi:hypothetical protein
LAAVGPAVREAAAITLRIVSLATVKPLELVNMGSVALSSIASSLTAAVLLLVVGGLSLGSNLRMSLRLRLGLKLSCAYVRLRGRPRSRWEHIDRVCDIPSGIVRG